MKKIRVLISDLLITISQKLPKLGWIITLLAAFIKSDKVSSDFLVRIKREKLWYKSDGDNTFLLDYDLDSRSVVFDVGGYIGNFTSSIYCRYGSEIYVFEPISEYVKKLENRFGRNDKIHIYGYGIGGETNEVPIFLSEGGTSLFSQHINYSESRNIKVLSISDVLSELKLTFVDLISVNIEGGEYPLLIDMIEKKLTINFKNIQIQFHQIDELSDQKRLYIRQQLQKTHKETFCFPFVWENWERIDSYNEKAVNINITL